jgi:hypothetical protein
MPQRSFSFQGRAFLTEIPAEPLKTKGGVVADE